MNHKPVNKEESLKEFIQYLTHNLPQQGPLKDFIHHNTLHSFQHLPFHLGLQKASQIYGAHVYLSPEEYQALYANKKIEPQILEKSIKMLWPGERTEDIRHKLLTMESEGTSSNLFKLRELWRTLYKIDIDKEVHPLLFRILGGFLDQGIALWKFPSHHQSFIESLRELETNSWSTIFPYKSQLSQRLLKDKNTTLEDLLKILVGKEDLYKHYVFDQQWAHPGWSGLVCVLEQNPQTLYDQRKISLNEVIFLELLLEIDFMEGHLKRSSLDLGGHYKGESLEKLLNPSLGSEYQKLLQCWQEAYEKSFYNEVMSAFKNRPLATEPRKPTLQALFCIDDRESSLRTYLELADANIETFGTPGFFGVEFYYKPADSYQITKLCPAPVNPRYLIKQKNSLSRRKKDIHIESFSHSFIGGWIITHTIGIWSAAKLFLNIFSPTLTPATATSLRHMEKESELIIQNDHPQHHEHGLQIGFTTAEMAERVYNMLMSIGLNTHFADLIYLVAHGSSSTNNPHYAAYDCGACSGRPGSVNARVFAEMANNEDVREILKHRGVIIPRKTLFVGALHDTTRDEILFFEEAHWPLHYQQEHQKNIAYFKKALAKNAQERARRFENIPLYVTPDQANEKVKLRSVSLFEPRPELNHATNSICIVGSRSLSKNIFLDRRAFLNSYNHLLDPDGSILQKILGAAVPVCGGINLEYYFSRVDNHKWGAGTKLPHNVMGLIGVANGTDGDLRPGLPQQMIELHDPIRLLIIVEQLPEIVLKAVQSAPATYEWIKNDWVRLACIDPFTQQMYFFEEEQMIEMSPSRPSLQIDNLQRYTSQTRENLPIAIIKDIK